MSYISKETTLRDYLRVIFRHKIVFIILPLAIMVPVYITLELKTPTYEASVKMYVKAQKDTESDFYRSISTPFIIEDHAEFIKSKVVLERVINALKLYQVPVDYERRFASRIKAYLIERGVAELKQNLSTMSEEQRRSFLFQMALGRLQGSISAIPVQGLSFFTITVRDFDPAVASRIANSVSRSYVIFDLEQQVAELKLQYGEKNSTVVKLENYIEEFQKTLDGKPLSDMEAMGPASVKIAQQAGMGGLSGGYNKGFLLVLSFAASIFFGVVLSFILDYFDQTIKSPRDIEMFLKIPFLGSIPKRKWGGKLLIDVNPGTSNYERSYQNLSEQILLLMKDKGMKTLLITDSEDTWDISVIGANIGMYLAHKRGFKVLIIDANLRHSSVSEAFKISNIDGLSDILEGKISLPDANIQVLGDNLYVLSSGKTSLNPLTLIGSSAMSNIINKVKETYDIVFLVCSGLKDYHEVAILSTLADGTALIVNEGKVRRQVAESSIIPLIQKKVSIIGVVLNNREYVIPHIIYKWT